jgi:hypothetical protein
MKFRKKPVVIEAVQWTGLNQLEIDSFVSCGKYGYGSDGNTGEYLIETLEGVMRASAGDWIIRGVKGEFYPCKPDIFTATYEPVYE